MRQKTPRACSNFQDDFVYEGPSSLKKQATDWTRSEDDKLENLLMDGSKEVNWKDVAVNFPGRKDLDCMARWKEINPFNSDSTKCIVASNSGKKKSWTEEEDVFLIKLIEKYGPQKWTFIAEHLPGTGFVTQAALANSVASVGTII